MIDVQIFVIQWTKADKIGEKAFLNLIGWLSYCIISFSNLGGKDSRH